MHVEMFCIVLIWLLQICLYRSCASHLVALVALPLCVCRSFEALGLLGGHPRLVFLRLHGRRLHASWCRCRRCVPAPLVLLEYHLMDKK